MQGFSRRSVNEEEKAVNEQWRDVMRIKLSCAAPLRRVITELLAARGLEVAEEADVVSPGDNRRLA